MQIVQFHFSVVSHQLQTLVKHLFHCECLYLTHTSYRWPNIHGEKVLKRDLISTYFLIFTTFYLFVVFSNILN